VELEKACFYEAIHGSLSRRGFDTLSIDSILKGGKSEHIVSKLGK